MILSTDLCTMKNKIQQNTNALSGIIVGLGILLSSVLYLFKHFNILDIDFEIILAPFIVITSLAFGDKIIIFFFLNPIGAISKFMKGYSKPS
jgi:hypothetical protein